MRYRAIQNGGKHETQAQDRANAGSFKNVERACRRRVQAKLSAAAQFVEADRDEGTEQREARRHWIDQRQQFVAEQKSCQNDADNWIDDAREKDVRRHGAKVVDASCERIPHIGDRDFADVGLAIAPEAGRGPAKLGAWIEDGMESWGFRPRVRHVGTHELRCRSPQGIFGTLVHAPLRLNP